VKYTSRVCPLMKSTNNGDWFSILMSLLEPATQKKNMSDPIVMRRNNFKDDYRVFDVPRVN
jgi:hypothetical protein